MGTCKYCGGKTGVLQSNHAECELKHGRGRAEMLELLLDGVSGRCPIDIVESKINILAKESFVGSNQLRDILIEAFEKAMDKFMKNTLKTCITENEEKALEAYIANFSLTEEELDRSGAYSYFQVSSLRKDIRNALKGSYPLDNLKSSLGKVSKEGAIDSVQFRDILIQEFENAIENYLEDGGIGENEEKALHAFTNEFSLTQEELERNNAFSKMMKSLIIRAILNGKLPQRLIIEGHIPFLFMKEEQAIWLFDKVVYFEENTITKYVGHSEAMTSKIGNGYFYRRSLFQADPISTTERVPVDVGVMVFTNKHIYFTGVNRAFRIPYSELISAYRYPDGIGIYRDHANACQQVFVTGDGWFCYNIIANIALLS